MTLERWLLLGFGVLNGVAGVIAAGAVAAGLPSYVALASAALVAGCGAALVLLRGWYDAAPPLPPHG